jgi:hypothetical protein
MIARVCFAVLEQEEMGLFGSEETAFQDGRVVLPQEQLL